MIEVWAPRARRMRVRRLDEHGATREERELDACTEGCWRTDIDLADGERYGFLIDDSEQLRPDPRSRRQPDGVHGPSAAFDPEAFAWSDGSWTGLQLAGGLIYELHLGTF